MGLTLPPRTSTHHLISFTVQSRCQTRDPSVVNPKLKSLPLWSTCFPNIPAWKTVLRMKLQYMSLVGVQGISYQIMPLQSLPHLCMIFLLYASLVRTQIAGISAHLFRSVSPYPSFVQKILILCKITLDILGWHEFLRSFNHSTLVSFSLLLAIAPWYCGHIWNPDASDRTQQLFS